MNTPLALVEPPSDAVSAQQDTPQGDTESQRRPFCPTVYDAISDRHRRVARMIGFGFCDETFAEACDMHPRVADRRWRGFVKETSGYGRGSDSVIRLSRAVEVL